MGEGARGEATFHYSIGPFCGRHTPLFLQAGLETTLRFRIPLELLHARERLTVEVRSGSTARPGKTIWAKRWVVAWRDKSPSLEPLAE